MLLDLDEILTDFGQMFRTIWGQTCSERSERSARSEGSEHEHCSGTGQPPPTAWSFLRCKISLENLLLCIAHLVWAHSDQGQSQNAGREILLPPLGGRLG